MAHSFFDFLETHSESIPDRPAARFKREGAWIDLNWRELKELADAVSAALVRFGLVPGERVSILSNSRVEWSLTDFAIVGAGGVTVPIYQSNTPEECRFILENSEAVFVFAEDAEQLNKLREIRQSVPGVRGVVCFDDGAVDAASDWETGWEEFLEQGRGALGDGQTVQNLAERRRKVGRDDLATLIYTSGTTGRPKGVQVTHENLIVAAEAVTEIDLPKSSDVQLLFLPLAHSFAKLLQIGWLASGSLLAYAEAIDTVVDNMGEIRPTLMASVPRIFEKVHAKVVGEASSQPGLKGKLARWAFAHAERAARVESQGGTYGGFGWWLARKLVFAKIHRRLSERFGGRLRFFVSGGAPLAPDIAYFFKYADITICEGYGLTETSSVTTFNRPERVKIGTVGPAMPGIELKIADDGEILIHGRTVFTGYWKRPEETAEVLSEDGWFSTGDIGEIDEDGHLKITDRKKDLIVTAGGKNVAPQHAENLLKSRSPLISQVVLFGDRRPYLVALVTLDEAALQEWAEKHGVSGTHAELSQRDDVRQLVQEQVEGVNSRLPTYETIKYVDVLDHDFEVGDQLTPTLKVKRKVVYQRYAGKFDQLYRQGEERQRVS